MGGNKKQENKEKNHQILFIRIDLFNKQWLPKIL